MVHLLIALFALLFSFNANAIYSPGCGSGQLQVAGMCLNMTGLIVLQSANTAANKTTFAKATPGSTSRGTYQVTTGKTFVLYAVCYDQITGAATTNISDPLLYADNDVGVSSGTAATNPVGMISGVAGGDVRDSVSAGINPGGNGTRCYAIGGSVPALKYPYVLGVNVLSVSKLYGYEI